MKGVTYSYLYVFLLVVLNIQARRVVERTDVTTSAKVAYKEKYLKPDTFSTNTRHFGGNRGS